MAEIGCVGLEMQKESVITKRVCHYRMKTAHMYYFTSVFTVGIVKVYAQNCIINDYVYAKLAYTACQVLICRGMKPLSYIISVLTSLIVVIIATIPTDTIHQELQGI